MNKIYVIQAISVVVIALIMGMMGWWFVRQNKDSATYIFENLDWLEERPIVLILTFWILLVRFLPLDVVLLSETGKMIYSKIIESDARMMTIDKETGEIVTCKVQSMQLPE